MHKNGNVQKGAYSITHIFRLFKPFAVRVFKLFFLLKLLP